MIYLMYNMAHTGVSGSGSCSNSWRSGRGRCQMVIPWCSDDGRWAVAVARWARWARWLARRLGVGVGVGEGEGGSGPCRLLQRSTRWTLDDGQETKMG